MTRPEGGRSALLLWSLLPWCLLLVVVTADVVLDGPLRAFDHSLATWFREHADYGAARNHGIHVWQETTLLLLTEFGSPLVLPVGAGGYAVVLAGRGRTPLPVARLAVGGVLAVVLVTLAKAVLGRTPPFDEALLLSDVVPADVLWTGDGRSYPSGHTVTAVVVWGIVAWLALSHGRSPVVRRVTGVLRWLGPVLTAVSLVVLGYHWLTDVVAGAAVGVLLLAAVREVDRRALAHLPGADRGIAGDRGGAAGLVRDAGGRGGPGAVHDPRRADP